LEVAPEATDKKRVTLLTVPGPQADRGTTAGRTLEEANAATNRERVTHSRVPGPQADRVTTARHQTLEFEKKLF
jgi:hypothetical protein